ncbi:MAG TPA: DUF1761 domain-containing protein [Gemmatimonadota bacterium]|nr:DUF1761 domain-containing protein [Gemmatimonadota bacterium]
MSLDFSQVNWLAVVAAGLADMVVGALWFSPVLFGKAWMRGAGVTDEAARANAARGYTLAIFASLVIAAVLAALFAGSGVAGPAAGARWGAVLGAGLVAMFVAMIHAFETRPTSLIAIDAGYAVAATAVMGAIVGAWR